MRLSIVFLIVCCTSAALFAQDDPFGSGNQQAPKANTAPIPTDKSIAELKELLVKEREESKRVTADYDDQIRHMKRAITEMGSHIDKLKAQNNRTQDLFAAASRGHAALTNLLLKSDDPEIQLAVIHSRLDNVGLHQFGFNNETLRILGKLTESENAELRKDAIGLLVSLHPEVANELGFQATGDTWKPVQLGWSEEQIKLDRMLSKVTDMHYDEVALFDIMDEIRDFNRVNVMTDQGVDPEKLFTLNVRGIPYCEALALLLEQHRLTLSIKNDVLYIGFIGNPQIQDTFTFNVRGLLTEKLDIEKLSSLIQDQIGDEVKINLLDDHRFVANCGYLEQREIGKILAKYNKSHR